MIPDGVSQQRWQMCLYFVFEVFWGGAMTNRQRLAAMLVMNAVIAPVSGGLVAWWVVRRAMVMTQPALMAQQFVLRDGSGHIGAKVSWEDGQPGLRLFDRANQVRSALFLEPNGVPDLYLYDSNKVARAALNLFDSGVPNLAFVDAAGKSMVWTAYDNDHAYNIMFVAIERDATRVLASRRITVDASGLHESTTSVTNESH